MSTASSSNPKTQDKSGQDADDKKKQEARPHLGVLEEDDEFEEFAAAGALVDSFSGHERTSLISLAVFFLNIFRD